MPSEIGPFDGRRARRKRCDACVKRRIKCRDGIPCENCKRTGRLCTAPSRPTTVMAVFVGEGTNNGLEIRKSVSTSICRPAIPLPQSMELDDDERTFSYFFTSFLPMNVLVSESSTIVEMVAMAKSSPALKDAIHAIAALHRKQQDQLAAAEASGSCEAYKALQSYGRSVRCMQSHIATNTFLSDPSALWTTFLLGLFELMRDSTGTNWLSHFLNGTCTILRLQRPENLIFPGTRNLQKRTFFLTTRIVEIARSLIYTSPTFLSEPEWTAVLATYWANEGASSWHPKEALFDFLPNFANLNIRTLDFCDNVPHISIDEQFHIVQSLAEEGLLLRQHLERWRAETATWEASHNQIKPDTELLIGYAYYHAISIYLSGIFDYHTHWSWPGAPCAPILSRSQIDWHVSEILRTNQELLTQGVSGILLFVPLRIAGARAVDERAKNTILDLLHTTTRRGFIVAEAFTVDLSQLWANQGLLL